MLNAKLHLQYNANFFGNILIVGRIGCGKTYFTQKLAANNFLEHEKMLSGYLALS